MSPKKVLLVAGKFPPEGGGAVIRAYKMAKYLGECGYQVYVLTRPPGKGALIDEGTLSELPSTVSIVRPHQPVMVERMLPLRYFRWALASFFIGKRLIEREKIDVLWSTSPPPPAQLLGYFLKRATHIPWIADFRDPWTQHMLTSISPWRRRLEELMERKVMATADAITTVTPSFSRNFQDRFGAVMKRIELIYNGFDPEDYADITVWPDDHKFTAAYAGLLYPARSPRLLLESVAELIQDGSIPRTDIALQFAGQLDAPGDTTHSDLIHALGLQDVVKIMGVLPHRQTLAMLKSADLLLLIGDALPGAADYIPGKLYEYMAVARPILALQVDGEAQHIIASHQLGTVVHPQDKAAIKRAYLDLYHAWKENQLPVGVTSSLLDIFDRRFQAQQLATLMNDLVLKASPA